MKKTQDINIKNIKSILDPNEIKDALPITETVSQTVYDTRETIKNILSFQDNRFLVIMGPCSIHNVTAGMEYAEKLIKLKEKYNDKLVICMRVYFEKPRTTVGWKGLINDPDINGSFNMIKGIQMAREFLLNVNKMGLPAASEMLDTLVPQYIADLISWASIGARTTESQPHREMASGLSMPIGYKNGTDGSPDVAINAIMAACHSHNFLGINQSGQLSIIETKGNPWGHVILRGGSTGPNYNAESVQNCINKLKKSNLPTPILIDCSHANSNKDFKNQNKVLKNTIEQRKNGNNNIIGVMLESNLKEGNQPIPKNISDLTYGQSITDQCVSWETSCEMLENLYSQL